MTLWSVKNPVSFGDNMSVTLTRFGTFVITRSSMLLPRVSLLLSCACQEVAVNGTKASSLAPDALSVESQRMSGKLKSPEITILLNWSQTPCRKLSNTSIQLGSSLGGP